MRQFKVKIGLIYRSPPQRFPLLGGPFGSSGLPGGPSVRRGTNGVHGVYWK